MHPALFSVPGITSAFAAKVGSVMVVWRKSVRIAGWTLGVLMGVAGQSIASADTIVDTTPGNSTLSHWGPTATHQYGQVITAPTTDTVLDSFSFTFNSDTA